jgi:hypothetical protein
MTPSWFDRTFDSGNVVRLDDVRPNQQRRWRLEDAREHRRRIMATARGAEVLVEETDGLIADMCSDGGFEDAVGGLKIAAWRLKKAVADLELAYTKVKP